MIVEVGFMKNTENKDGWDWQYHETRIYPEEFYVCLRKFDKWGGKYRYVRTDEEAPAKKRSRDETIRGVDDYYYDPNIWDFDKVAPEDRDLFLRLLDVRAKENIAVAINNNNKPERIGAAIVLTGCLYMIYDFCMAYFQIGQ